MGEVCRTKAKKEGKAMNEIPTIVQMNYAIAKFMGFEKVTVGYTGTEEETEWQNNHIEWMHKVGIQLVGDYIVNVKENLWYGWEGVSYHTSWDWLMPVGKKIYDLLDKMQTLRPPHTACRGDVLEVDIRCHIMEYNLPNAHESIYQFITWLNQQTTTNEQ